MAKAKSPKKAAAGKGKGKAVAKAAPAEESKQLALPMPKDRDLKHYISAIQVQQARVKKEQQTLSKIYADADDSGVSVPAIKTGLRIMDTEPLQARSDLMQLALVLAELGAPVQFEVYDPKFGSVEAQAKVEGYKDGKGGKDRDYRSYIKGSPARRAYDHGYEEGSIENMPISPSAKKDALAKLEEPGPSTAH